MPGVNPCQDLMEQDPLDGGPGPDGPGAIVWPSVRPCRSRGQSPRRQVQRRRDRSHYSLHREQDRFCLDEAGGAFPGDAAEVLEEGCGAAGAGPVVVACGGDSEE
jgi:hypothetical protein